MPVVDEYVEPTGVYKEDLQDAAREWVKYLENFPNDEFEAYYEGSTLNVAKWIKHFFNLEDD
jgi:hypothetical protein